MTREQPLVLDQGITRSKKIVNLSGVVLGLAAKFATSRCECIAADAFTQLSLLLVAGPGFNPGSHALPDVFLVVGNHLQSFNQIAKRTLIVAGPVERNVQRLARELTVLVTRDDLPCS